MARVSYSLDEEEQGDCPAIDVVVGWIAALATPKTVRYTVRVVSEVMAMSTVEVPVPEGMDPATFQQYVAEVVANRSAVSRVATVMEQQEAEVGPATVAQLARVEHLRRHLAGTYGVLRAADIATLRGAKATNRSVATHLARTQGLLGYTVGRAKVYPAFQFKGSQVHPRWGAVSVPLVEAGWEEEDILLWMASANAALAGREPAALIDGRDEDVAALLALVEQEARGTW